MTTYRYSCLAKRAYGTHAEAEAVAVRMRRRKGAATEPAEAYRCAGCGLWHVATIDRALRHQEREAAAARRLARHPPPELDPEELATGKRRPDDNAECQLP